VRRLRQAAGEEESSVAAPVQAVLSGAPSAEPRVPGGLPASPSTSPLAAVGCLPR